VVRSPGGDCTLGAGWPAQQCGLRARRGQERFLLRHIQARGDAAVVSRAHEIQRAAERVRRAIQDAELGIDLPQREVVGRQIRGHYEADVFEHRRARFERGARGLDAAQPPSEEIDLIADRKRKGHGILGHRVAVGAGARPG
jgi:hypothetical protein